MTITIRTENAAFDGNKEVELARILRELADRFEHGQNPKIVRDSNGNTVGQVKGK